MTKHDESTTSSVPTATDHDSLSYHERRRITNPTRKRHGARNQHKMKHFCRWLASTFPDAFASSSPILDVAGGKGELAARLVVCERQSVIMIDPRPSSPLDCFLQVVLPKLPKKWQERTQQQVDNNPQFLQDIFDQRFTQIVECFDPQHALIADALDDCCLLLGMHADAATEAIVDVALAMQKPFCVVPCCVFPNLFPRHVSTEQGRLVEVRNHEQFCRYLLAKDARLQSTRLDFEGRNLAIWWKGVS